MKIRRSKKGVVAIPTGGKIWPPVSIALTLVLVDDQDRRRDIVLRPERVIFNSAYPGRKERKIR
jgi:hypothetical protein